MIKKLFLIVVISLFIATNAYAALVETPPKFTTSCYMIGTQAVVSGDVVVLTDDADTTRTIEFYGREVTGTITEGEPIYGVVVDTRSLTATQMISGKWVNIQTYGYCPIIKLDDSCAVTGGTSILVTSDAWGKATTCQDLNFKTSEGDKSYVTGTTISIESKSPGISTSHTVKGWLNW